MIIVTGVFMVLIIGIKLSSSTQSVNHLGNPIFHGTIENAAAINQLLTQISSLHLTSQQDNNPILSLIHSCYALGCFHALQNSLLKEYSPEQVQRLFRLNTTELQDYLEQDQRRSMHDLERLYPSLSMPNVYTIGSIL